MLIPDEKSFYDVCRRSLFGGKIVPSQFQRLKALVDHINDVPVLLPAQAAYILASAHWETDRFNAMEEYASGEGYEGRADLGNTLAGDGKRFKGRGFPMLTGRRNYEWGSKASGRNLLESPDIATEPEISARLIVLGMLSGYFTGVGLGRYINAGKTDFVSARRTINGLDRAELIADIAGRYLAAIHTGSSHVSSSSSSRAIGLLSSASLVSRMKVPARRAPRFAQAVACGSSITVVWTAVASSGLLPPALATVEVVTAVSGLLSALASAVGLCNFFRPSPSDGSREED